MYVRACVNGRPGEQIDCDERKKINRMKTERTSRHHNKSSIIRAATAVHGRIARAHIKESSNLLGFLAGEGRFPNLHYT